MDVTLCLNKLSGANVQLEFYHNWCVFEDLVFMAIFGLMNIYILNKLKLPCSFFIKKEKIPGQLISTQKNVTSWAN
jgi:hypothetical protein